MLKKQTNKRVTGGSTELCQQVWGKKWGITGKWKDKNPVTFDSQIIIKTIYWDTWTWCTETLLYLM